MPRPTMRARYDRGSRAELWAALFLMCKGYRLLARRYKTRHGEADLVMRRGHMVVFVEVKARHSVTGGLEAISPRSQVRIMAAAQHFMARHARFAGFDCRFDAVVVRPLRLPYHVPDAWRATI